MTQRLRPFRTENLFHLIALHTQLGFQIQYDFYADQRAIKTGILLFSVALRDKVS